MKRLQSNKRSILVSLVLLTVVFMSTGCQVSSANDYSSSWEELTKRATQASLSVNGNAVPLTVRLKPVFLEEVNKSIPITFEFVDLNGDITSVFFGQGSAFGLYTISEKMGSYPGISNIEREQLVHSFSLTEIHPAQALQETRKEWDRFANQHQITTEPIVLVDLLMLRQNKPTWFIRYNTSKEFLQLHIDAQNGQIIEVREEIL